MVEMLGHAVFVDQDGSGKHDAFLELSLYSAAVSGVDDAVSVSLSVKEAALVDLATLAVLPSFFYLALVSTADKVLAGGVVHLHAAVGPAVHRVANPVLRLVVKMGLASAVWTAFFDFPVVANLSALRVSDVPDLLS